jgi:hypothetical protein
VMSMHVDAMRSRSSDTKTWTPGCAKVSCQTRSARSRGSAARLTSDAANSARSEGKSGASASRTRGIAVDIRRAAVRLQGGGGGGA